MHMWNNIELTDEQFNKAKVYFILESANIFTKNTEIGASSVQLLFIRNREEHAITQNLPVISKKTGQITAYINVSIAALSDKDIYNNENKPTIPKSILYSYLDSAIIKSSKSNISNVKTNIICVKIYSLEYVYTSNLQHIFVVINFAGLTLTSKKYKYRSLITLNLEFRFPIAIYLLEDIIQIQIWNSTLMSKSLLCEGGISFSSIKFKSLDLGYYNFYGKSVKDNNMFGSYLGKILISCEVRKPINNAIISPSIVFIKKKTTLLENRVIVTIDLYCLIQNNIQAHQLCINIEAEKTWINIANQYKSEMNNISTGYNSFEFDENNGRIINISVNEFLNNTGSSVDLFVELYDINHNRLCYNNIKLKNIPLVNDQALSYYPTWIDLHDNEMNSSASLLINIEKNNQQNAKPRHRRILVKQRSCLRCYIYNLRNLPYIKKTKMPPQIYIEIWCDIEKKLTKISKEVTRFPILLEYISFDINIFIDQASDLIILPPLNYIIKNYEDNTIVGTVVTTIDRIITSSEEAQTPTPIWKILHNSSNDYYLNIPGVDHEKFGAILTYAELVAIDIKNYVAPHEIFPELVSAKLSIPIWGLRSIAKLNVNTSISDIINSDIKKIVQSVTKPIIVIYLPQFVPSTEGTYIKLAYKYKKNSKEAKELSNNYNFCDIAKDCTSCFDFLYSYSIDILLPNNIMLDPYMIIKIYDKKITNESFVGEISHPLKKYLPNYIHETENIVEGQLNTLFTELNFIRQQNFYQHILNRMINYTTKNKRTSYVTASKTYINSKQEIASAELNTSEITDDQNNFKFCDSTGIPYFATIVRTDCYKYGIININELIFYKKGNIRINTSTALYVEYNNTAKAKQINSMTNLTNNPGDRFVLSCYEEINRIDSWIYEELYNPMYIVQEQIIKVGYIIFNVTLNNTIYSSDNTKSETSKNYNDIYELRKAMNIQTLYGLKKFRLTIFSLSMLTHRNKKYTDDNIKAMIEIVIGGKTIETFECGRGVDCNINQSVVYDLLVPENSICYIYVYDEQTITKKSAFIGYTRIDLLQRLLIPNYISNSINGTIPSEIRPLIKLTSEKINYGSIKILAEIVDVTNSFMSLKLQQEPNYHEIELRVVIWGCKSLKLFDDNNILIRQPLDVYVVSEVEFQVIGQPAMQKTDIHYGSTNGLSLYNYRFVYKKIKFEPGKNFTYRLSAYQFYTLNPSKLIGEVLINYYDYFESVSRNQESLSYDVELKLLKNNEIAGYLLANIQILTSVEADLNPVGLARLPPNKDPHLNIPANGRSWNDFLGTGNRNYIFDTFWYYVRIFIIVICILVTIIVGFISPAIFYHDNLYQ